MNMGMTMQQRGIKRVGMVMKHADMTMQQGAAKRAVTIMPEVVIMYTNIIMTKHANALHVRRKKKN